MNNNIEIMLNPEKFGYIHCPHCNIPLEKFTPTTAARQIMQEYKGKQVIISAPLYSSLKDPGRIYPHCPQYCMQVPHVLETSKPLVTDLNNLQSIFCPKHFD